MENNEIMNEETMELDLVEDNDEVEAEDSGVELGKVLFGAACATAGAVVTVVAGKVVVPAAKKGWHWVKGKLPHKKAKTEEQEIVAEAEEVEDQEETTEK